MTSRRLVDSVCSVSPVSAAADAARRQGETDMKGMRCDGMCDA